MKARAHHAYGSSGLLHMFLTDQVYYQDVRSLRYSFPHVLAFLAALQTPKNIFPAEEYSVASSSHLTDRVICADYPNHLNSILLP